MTTPPLEGKHSRFFSSSLARSTRSRAFASARAVSIDGARALSSSLTLCLSLISPSFPFPLYLATSLHVKEIALPWVRRLMPGNNICNSGGAACPGAEAEGQGAREAEDARASAGEVRASLGRGVLC